MRERSDEQLMLDYAAGQISAFEQLYERYRVPLYNFILRQVSEPATANDLYQGSWEKIIKARQSYRQAAPFRAWMFRIARNHLADHFRRLPVTTHVEFDSLVDGSAGPAEQLAVMQDAAALKQAIEQLPEEQREVLLLKLEGGQTIKSIAVITGVTPETAKSRLRYALAKLQPLLRDNDYHSGEAHGEG